MVAHVALADTTIDADSVLIESILFALRDNLQAFAEGNAPFQLVNAALASSAVRQGNIATSVGSVSTASNFTNLTLPGGSYGFYPQLRCSDNSTEGRIAHMCGNHSATVGGLSSATAVYNTSFATNITLGTTAGTMYAQQRYVNSSPPYDLGDGAVPVFVFARVDSAGRVIDTYVADVPPWAYNGPTRVTADAIDVASGKKYQRRKILSPDGEIVVDLVEVGDTIKNADMPLIPHPFNLAPGDSAVLLDPPATEELLSLHETGESVNDLLGSDLIIDNVALNRAAPPGVMPVAIKWKNTIQKWRAAPAIAAKLQTTK